MRPSSEPSRGRRAAVLGSPIRHSLSPVLHSAAYAALGLDWTYSARECDEAGLPALLDGLDRSWVGLSLTMPLKTAVLPLLDTVTPLAEAVAAVNTVLLDGGRHGDNTDVGGVAAALRRAGLEPGESPLVLGAGGTARAAVAGLAELGARAARVAVRDRSRAAALLETARRLGVEVDLRDLDPAALAGASLVVSTLPAGAADRLVAGAPWPFAVPLFDVVYSPWPTAAAAAATAAGAPVVGGLALLVEQAALQVERMTGLPAPVEAMHRAGLAACGRPGAGPG